jgi:hypothetical protein
MGFDPSEKPREVRYLRVMSAALAENDDALLAFSVNCPRRGMIGVEDCLECSHGVRLRHHGRRGPLVLECSLEKR